ncbi:MAG: hypothetical protein JW888_05675 [Pirellulales bacterium]|nr:hypothetical protein [Pirellulales bacterium]
MTTRSPRLILIFAVLVGLLLAASSGSAATCTLKPKQLDSGRRARTRSALTPDWLFQLTSSQRFHAQFQPKVVVKDGKEEQTWTIVNDNPRAFKAVVKKQPRKYNAEIPFRGVAKLGDQRFGFVLDSPDPDTENYGLLYFDRNGNGDLTDDPPIESIEVQKEKERVEREKKAPKEEKAKGDAKKTDAKEKAKKKAVARRSRRVGVISRSSSNHTFPPIDLKIKIDGKKVDYRFFFSVYSYFRKNYGYASASLTAGVYYEGEIELDGRKQRVVLVDYNSNGQFDDTSKTTRYSSGRGLTRLGIQNGDVLFLDPKPVGPAESRNLSSLGFRHSVEKLLCLDGRYFDLKVAPAGDELTLEPSDISLGSVTNPNANYTAVIYGDNGTMTISGTAGKPVAVPEGKWKLLSYTIDLTKVVEAAEKKAEEVKKAEAEATKDNAKKEKGTSLFGAMVKAMTETAGTNVPTRPAVQRPKTTRAVAMATTAGKSITVVKGETVLLPFGPPYKPVVAPSYFQSNNDSLHLGLDLVGSGGEVLTSLTVKGGRPPKPTIKILDPKGEVVNEGNFEYG